MKRILTFDPSTFTNRLFGGILNIDGWCDDHYLYNNNKTKRWKLSDVDKGWNEGFNPLYELGVW